MIIIFQSAPDVPRHGIAIIVITPANAHWFPVSSTISKEMEMYTGGQHPGQVMLVCLPLLPRRAWFSIASLSLLTVQQSLVVCRHSAEVLHNPLISTIRLYKPYIFCEEIHTNCFTHFNLCNSTQQSHRSGYSHKSTRRTQTIKTTKDICWRVHGSHRRPFW